MPFLPYLFVCHQQQERNSEIHGKIVTFIINESTEKSFTEKVVDFWISNNVIEYYTEWNWGECGVGGWDGVSQKDELWSLYFVLNITK